MRHALNTKDTCIAIMYLNNGRRGSSEQKKKNDVRPERFGYLSFGKMTFGYLLQHPPDVVLQRRMLLVGIPNAIPGEVWDDGTTQRQYVGGYIIVINFSAAQQQRNVESCFRSPIVPTRLIIVAASPGGYRGRICSLRRD